MNEKTAKSVSKFLSLVLRHSPEKIGLKLDENGWADVEELIEDKLQKNIDKDARLAATAASTVLSVIQYGWVALHQKNARCQSVVAIFPLCCTGHTVV